MPMRAAIVRGLLATVCLLVLAHLHRIGPLSQRRVERGVPFQRVTRAAALDHIDDVAVDRLQAFVREVRPQPDVANLRCGLMRGH